MFQWILSTLASPVINGMLKGYQMKLKAAGESGQQAVEVAKAAMVAEVQARAEANKVNIAFLGKWYTALPMVLVMGSAAAYFVKIIFWDVLLGLGSTDPLRGDIQTTYNMVIAFWFGSAAIKGAIVAARTWWR
jgi:hypothetical protein